MHSVLAYENRTTEGARYTSWLKVVDTQLTQ
jgi:hypothetical protein